MRFVFFLFSLCTSLQALILEAPSFQSLLDYADPDTLILLDIDDTLLIPSQMLGCDEWFFYRFNSHQEKGDDSQTALEKSLAEWEAIRHLTEMEIVELGTEKVVESLQKSSIPLMALTTQGLSLSTRTSQQLLDKQIDLTQTAPSQNDFYFLVEGHAVLYRNGILSTSGTHKGKALFQFLDGIDFHPKRIVFINDKVSHLAQVETEAEKRGVESIGLRYSYSDSRKKAFSPLLAEYQFSHSSFSHILSDKEALEKMGEKESFD